MFAWAAFALQGPIESDEIWRAASGPYEITRDLEIPPGITLTILPGTLIQVHPNVEILIRGTLKALGTEEAPITFTAAPGRGNRPWRRLRFQGASANDSLLLHCVIERAEIGILGDTASPRIRDCLIQANARWGIHLIRSTAEVLHNRIWQNGWSLGGGGLLIEGQVPTGPTVRYNLIAGNQENGLTVRRGAIVSLFHNTFARNSAAGLVVGPQGQVVAVQNVNFLNNRRADLINQSSWEIDARNNYWGWEGSLELSNAISSEENLSFIEDKHDQPGWGGVRWDPWATVPIDIERAYQTWKQANPLTIQRPEGPAPAARVQSNPARGYILYVYSRQKKLLVDYTKEDHIKKGMPFSILRDGTKIGVLRIEKVGERWSEARLQGVSVPVQAGDRIALEPKLVVSDTSWISSRQYTPTWNTYHLARGQERFWENSVVFRPEEVSFPEGLRRFLTQTSAQVIWNRSTLHRGKIYFRKQFKLDAQPVRAILQWAMGCPGELYLNEQWVGRFSDPRQIQELDVTRYLQKGRNILAVVGTRGDPQQSSFGLGIELMIERAP